MKNTLLFLIGITVSGIIGYRYGYSVSKKKYEKLADEEIESVKKHFEKRYESKPSKQKDTKNSPIDISDKGDVDNKVGVDYGKQYRTTTEPDRIPGNPGKNFKILKKEEVDNTKPYIISMEEFEDSEYEAVTLFYFVDKTLTDDDYNQLTNVGIVGGYLILDQMGKYYEGCLYVRDDKNGIDYEIHLDERTYDKVKPIGIVE